MPMMLLDRLSQSTPVSVAMAHGEIDVDTVRFFSLVYYMYCNMHNSATLIICLQILPFWLVRVNHNYYVWFIFSCLYY